MVLNFEYNLDTDTANFMYPNFEEATFLNIVP